MTDLNFNGIDDYVELTNDWNYNGIDDYVELTNDWNYNGIDDYVELTNDWNYNGIDDYVELTNDWNYNGIDDSLEQSAPAPAPIVTAPAVETVIAPVETVIAPAVETILAPVETPAPAPIWETAPADDLDAALAFADALLGSSVDVSDPSAGFFFEPSVVGDFAIVDDFNEVSAALDAIAGPEAIASVIGVEATPSTTLDDLVWMTTFDAAERNYQEHLLGTGMFGQFSWAGLSRTHPVLDFDIDAFINDAKASGAWQPGAGGLDGLIQSEIVFTELMTEIERRDFLLSSDDAVFAAIDTTGLGFTLDGF